MGDQFSLSHCEAALTLFGCGQPFISLLRNKLSRGCSNKIKPHRLSLFAETFDNLTDLAPRKWTMPIRDWKSALNRFATEFEGRFPT